MKLRLAVLAFILTAGVAKADTIVNVSAVTCGGCWLGQEVMSFDLEAQLTVTPVTGNFWYPFYGTTVADTFDEVTSMVGTLNGNPITMVPPPGGDGNWLWPAPNEFALGAIYFNSAGSLCLLQFDNSSNLLEVMDANGDGFGSNTPINWTATDPPVDAPEPGTLALLLAGSLCCVGLRRKRMLKTK